MHAGDAAAEAKQYANNPSGTQGSEQDDENKAQTKQNSGGNPEITEIDLASSLKVMNKLLLGDKPEQL